MPSTSTSIRLLITGVVLCFIAVFCTPSCSKKSNPVPPADTVTVIKNDTTTKTDTLYATKPDPTVNLTQGLLLYLNFTGNIADSSGNNNPTQEIGSVLTYDEHGYVNNAFGSSGNGNEVLVTNNGSIQFDTAWTLSFDFMVNSNGTMTYVSMANPANGEGPSFIIGTTFPSLPYVDLGIGDISSGCDNYGTVNNVDIADTTNFTPVVGRWYNMIAAYHNGSARIYLNGSLMSSKTGTGTAAQLCSASQIMIGAWWNGDQQSMNGALDNIRLYNRVLTPHEIVALASNYQVTSTGQKRLVQHRTL